MSSRRRNTPAVWPVVQTRRMTTWMLDELAHAGQEHLDDAYVAGYEAKAGYDPGPDVDRAASTSASTTARRRRPRRRHRRVRPPRSPPMPGASSPSTCRRRWSTCCAGAPAGPRQRRGRARRVPDATSTPARRRTSCSRATRCTSSPTSGRASPSPASPRMLRPGGHRAPPRPRVRLRAGRRRRGDRRVGRRRRRRPGAGLDGRRARRARPPRAQHVLAGCSSRCCGGPASRSSTSEYQRGAYGTYTLRAPAEPSDRASARRLARVPVSVADVTAVRR